jgi:hypothetical protein
VALLRCFACRVVIESNRARGDACPSCDAPLVDAAGDDGPPPLAVSDDEPTRRWPGLAPSPSLQPIDLERL